jgi:hypothetical protein
MFVDDIIWIDIFHKVMNNYGNFDISPLEMEIASIYVVKLNSDIKTLSSVYNKI